MTTETALPPPVGSDGTGITFRPYRGLDDIPGMAAANERMRRRAGRLEPIDVPSMEHHYRNLVNSDPATDCLVIERAGATAGYVRVEWHDLEDGGRLYEHTIVVEPGAWGMGVADRCIAWGEARLRQVAVAHPTDRAAWFGGFAFGGDTELEQALAAHDYVPARWGATMIRPNLDGLPAVPVLPPGYDIRPLTPDRVRDVGAMLIVAFREDWSQHQEHEAEIEEWLGNPTLDVHLFTVVWHDDEPVAVVASETQTHPDGRPIGYVASVATHPAHRRLGLARAALTDSLHRLAADGQTRAYLGVDADNDNRAFELYEQAGFVRVTTDTSYRKPFAGREVGP